MISGHTAVRLWRYIAGIIAAVSTFVPFQTCIAEKLPSRSMSESQKRGSFVRSVCVSPRRFTWEGKEVSVLESWLENNTQGEELCFKLSFDGKPEFRSNRQEAFLVFRDDSARHTVLSSGEFVCGRRWTPTAILRATVPGLALKAAYICRFAELKLPGTKTIQLRAGSVRASTGGTPIMTDTVLTFDLAGDGK